MVNYYDLALKIISDMTLSELKKSFDMLESMGIWLDYSTLEIGADFSYINAQYPTNISLDTLSKKIIYVYGIEIDYDAMALWDC